MIVLKEATSKLWLFHELATFSLTLSLELNMH